METTFTSAVTTNLGVNRLFQLLNGCQTTTYIFPGRPGPWKLGTLTKSWNKADFDPI